MQGDRLVGVLEEVVAVVGVELDSGRAEESVDSAGSPDTEELAQQNLPGNHSDRCGAVGVHSLIDRPYM